MNPTSSSVCSALRYHLTRAGSCQGKNQSFLRGYSVCVQPSHTPLCIPNNRAQAEGEDAPVTAEQFLLCGFQLLDRRRQHYSMQKPFAIRVAASASQKRPGGTKTHKQEAKGPHTSRRGSFCLPLSRFLCLAFLPQHRGQSLCPGWADHVQLLPASLPEQPEVLLGSPAHVLLTLLQRGCSG